MGWLKSRHSNSQIGPCNPLGWSKTDDGKLTDPTLKLSLDWSKSGMTNSRWICWLNKILRHSSPRNKTSVHYYTVHYYTVHFPHPYTNQFKVFVKWKYEQMENEKMKEIWLLPWSSYPVRSLCAKMKMSKWFRWIRLIFCESVIKFAQAYWCSREYHHQHHNHYHLSLSTSPSSASSSSS